MHTEAYAIGAAALLALGLLALCAKRLYGLARDVRADMRKLHLQQSNIVQMLLRAGFRPARGSLDWRDDADATQAAPDFTKFDWRKPTG